MNVLPKHKFEFMLHRLGKEKSNMTILYLQNCNRTTTKPTNKQTVIRDHRKGTLSINETQKYRRPNFSMLERKNNNFHFEPVQHLKVFNT